jgi:hypothetical protein
MLALAACPAGCSKGGKQTADAQDTGAGANGGVDSAAHDTGGGTDGGVDSAAGPDGTQETGDAGATDATCNELQQMAQAAFDSFVATHRGCASDSDCVGVPPPGRCLDSCYYLLNRASVSAATDTAAPLCAEFIAQGCSLPILLCPALPPLACDGGTCTIQ